MNSRADTSWSIPSGIAQSGSTPTLWRAFAGFGLWAVCFTVLYTVHALACTWVASSSGSVGELFGGTEGVTWLLVVFWLFFVLWLVVLTLRSGLRARAVRHQVESRVEHRRDGDATNGDCRLQNPNSKGWLQVQRRSLRFMVNLTFVVDITAVVITVINGLPIILTPACL